MKKEEQEHGKNDKYKQINFVNQTQKLHRYKKVVQII
jgi:hypothetical protein